jgi:hypothetical protein
MSIAEELHAALEAAGLPIAGVALSESEPKEKWRVDWQAKATPEDEAAAAAVIEAFDPAAAILRDGAAKFLRGSDAKMARVSEDVISVLIAKGVITAADLPEAVRDLVAARKLARDEIGKR